MTISEELAGRRVAVTGVTGFVGQALLARLLEDVPSCQLVLLVRSQEGRSARTRIEDLLTWQSAFGRLREQGRLDEALQGIEVVDTDLDGDAMRGGAVELPPVDTLIHVAGTVSFDSRIDEAFATHAVGVDALYAAARGAGCDHVIHVSTAYVVAGNPGPVPEGPVRVDLDWRTEAAAAAALAERVELASRQPARLERFLDEARREVGPSGQRVVADTADAARRRWVDDQLVEAGRQRARTLGFSDVYTFSKAAGERVAEEHYGDHRLTIVRPTIVESALRHPFPGWIEGFKVADPLIIGLGRGDIPDFPGYPDGVVDLVPVDFVANAVIVACAYPPPTGDPAYVTSGTGARNPLTIRRMYELVRAAFDRDPLPGSDGRGVRLPVWSFAGPDQLARRLAVATSASRMAKQALAKLPVTGDRVRRVGRSLDRQHRRFAGLTRFVELYGSYALVESVFLDDGAARLRGRLAPEDRDAFDFDPADIDWQHYLEEIHVPAVSAFFRLPPTPGRGRPRRPGRLPARTDDDPVVIAVFDLDGTVASTNVYSAYLRARWSDAPSSFPAEAWDVLRSAPGYLALDGRSRERFLRAFYRRFAGADLAALDRLVADRLGDQLRADLAPAAVRRIREHRDRGHRTVLVTGALRSFCEPLRPLFDDIVAVDLATDATGRATGDLAAPPVVGAARAAWLRWYATQVDADLDASYAYADSRSDIPLLRAVGHPVAVDPDVALHRVARRERWPVAEWRRQPTGARSAAPSLSADAAPTASAATGSEA